MLPLYYIDTHIIIIPFISVSINYKDDYYYKCVNTFLISYSYKGSDNDQYIANR